jgi:hypothetical protein
VGRQAPAAACPSSGGALAAARATAAIGVSLPAGHPSWRSRTSTPLGRAQRLLAQGIAEREAPGAGGVPGGERRGGPPGHGVPRRVALRAPTPLGQIRHLDDAYADSAHTLPGRVAPPLIWLKGLAYPHNSSKGVVHSFTKCKLLAGSAPLFISEQAADGGRCKTLHDTLDQR